LVHLLRFLLIEHSKDINQQTEDFPTIRLLKESSHLSLQKAQPLACFCEALISACKSESLVTFDLAKLFEQLEFTVAESFALACAVQPEVKQEVSHQGLYCASFCTCRVLCIGAFIHPLHSYSLTLHQSQLSARILVSAQQSVQIRDRYFLDTTIY
jgi:hypothetical protein